MKRRALLTVVGTTALAGCTVGYSPATGGGVPRAPPSERFGLAEQGFPPTICEEERRPELVRAIDVPVLGPDWDHPDIPSSYLERGGLTDDAPVVGVSREGIARAYPLSVLARHEAVNDSFESRSKAPRTPSDGEVDVPVLVTFCPLCGSGMVARREVRGEETTFGVSGLLWDPPDAYVPASEADGRVFAASEGGIRETGNLVLYDLATGSRWSQILARSICGPLAGERFEILPSSFTTWGEWRAEYPDAEVLLPPPISGTL